MNGDNYSFDFFGNEEAFTWQGLQHNGINLLSEIPMFLRYCPDNHCTVCTYPHVYEIAVAILYVLGKICITGCALCGLIEVILDIKVEFLDDTGYNMKLGLLCYLLDSPRDEFISGLSSAITPILGNVLKRMLGIYARFRSKIFKKVCGFFEPSFEGSSVIGHWTPFLPSKANLVGRLWSGASGQTDIGLCKTCIEPRRHGG